MLADGLFERFPCKAVFGLHNHPGLDLGRFAIGPGLLMAGGAFFDLTIHGVGPHGGRPETVIDPIVVAAQIVPALQVIVASNLSPREPAVLSVTRISGCNAPDEVLIAGTALGLQAECCPDRGAAAPHRRGNRHRTRRQRNARLAGDLSSARQRARACDGNGGRRRRDLRLRFFARLVEHDLPA